MILLSITMFVLGVLAFTDALFNYGNMFRMLFSALLIFMSAWVYMKTRDLNDLGKPETTSAYEQNEDSMPDNDVELTQRIDNSKEELEKIHH